MYLPNEIILHIFKSLKKSDLKSARLVSKTWSTFAAERLFDQAYVSAHSDNLDVFIAITQHPLLSKCVKTLRYDAVDFVDNYTKTRYFHNLWQQTLQDFRTLVGPESLKAPTSDPETDTWLTLVLGATSDCDLLEGDEYYLFALKKCKDHRFIYRSYQKFQRYAALQRAQFNDDNFFETLVRGLQKLSNLACVIMEDRWPRPQRVLDHPVRLSLTRNVGSPMARNWSITHLCPQKWEWMPQNDGSDLASASGATDGAKHYWAITGALKRSQRKIQNFVLGHEHSLGVPPYVFDKSHVGSLSFDSFDLVAFSGLKELRLSIAAYGDEATPEYFPNMDGLRSLLGSMHHLEVLDLDFPAEPKDHPMLYNLNQIFPQEGQWSQLRSLSVQKFASSAEDFLTLLIFKSPILSDLRLGMVQLLTGSWEGVIECMMQSMHLSNFDVILNFLVSKHNSYGIEEYVENGGRHPCLQTDEPDSAAQNYVTEDLEQFCRAGFYPQSNHTGL